MHIARLHQQLKHLTSLKDFWHVQLRRASAIPVARDPSYARINDDDINVFRSIVGDTGVVTDSSALEPLNE